MDASKFFEEYKRLCLTYQADCNGCPLNGKVGVICAKWCVEHPEEAIAVVEKWAAEHPRKTRQGEFLKQYPNVRLDTACIIDISPCRMDPRQYPFNGKDCCRLTSCAQCRREFWMQEVE